MYANAISLVGTERGVGVNNAGNIGMSTGSLSISTSGRIQNTGTLNGSSVSLKTQRDIENKGNMIASNSIAVRSVGGIDNIGSIRGNTSLSVSTQNKLLNKDSIEARQSVSINSSNVLSNKRGRIDSGGAISINASKGVENFYGRIHSGSSMSINTGGTLNNMCNGKRSCGIMSDGALSVHARKVDTKDAFIGAKGKPQYK